MPGIPANITIAGRTPATIKGRVAPLINTLASARGGFRASGPDAPEFTVSKTDTSITALITNGYGAESYESRAGSGAWSAGLTVSGLTTETAYAMQVRGINSDGTGLAASVSITTNAPYNSVGVIFSESFDDQPDWVSPLGVFRATEATIPDGWFSTRAFPKWAPSTGHPDRHEAIEILASNADKSRSGIGKSFVSYRDCNDPGQSYWNSESMLTKYFPDGHSQIYAEFWIRFGPNWTRENITGSPMPYSKLFRVSSWRGNGSEYKAFSDGNLGPMALWIHNTSAYGMRMGIDLRGGPHSDNYQFVAGDLPDLGGFIVSGSNGDLNMSFKNSLSGMAKDGGYPSIPDRVNGGFITPSSGDIEHDNVFGPGDAWTKMAFFVKMNSAPGVTDGEYRQWLNDEQVLFSTQIPWIRPSATEDENAKWNIVAIGGNDLFQTYPNADRREEWYSIDDLVVRDSIPENLL